MEMKKRLGDLMSSALIAWMMNFSLTAMLISALTDKYSLILVAAATGCVAFLCALAALNRVTALITAGLGLIGAAAMLIFRETSAELIGNIVYGFGALVRGDASDMSRYATMDMIALAVVLGAVSMVLVRLSGGVFPALLLHFFVLLGNWFLNRSLQTGLLIPGLVALAVLYARSYRERNALLNALPAALIAALIAVMLMPPEGAVYQPLQDAADKMREMFNDYFMFDDPRVIYSVSADGYQPRVDRLGGPATPRQEDVMLVRSDYSMLLRGAVSRTYTGDNWVDEAVNSRYLFAAPTRVSRRNRTFDADKSARLSAVTQPIRAEVTFLGPGTSTLFVPHRLTSLNTRIDMPAYYNETGEVFLTRAVEEGDSYSFEAVAIAGEADDLAAAVNAARDPRDVGYGPAAADYLPLPGGIDRALVQLVNELIRDEKTPIGQAMAIQAYLTGGEFTYTLDGAYAPQGRDFVSWFVLEEKKGYCTYYASAMAVMARLAGIPARYAEGYRVISNGSGEVIVTGESAHAWAELYFEGAGWIAFDATPGDGGQQDPAGGQNQDDEPGQGENSGDTALWATPTPEPQGGGPAATPTPEPTRDDPQDTPEPPRPETDDSPEDDPDERENGWAWLVWILIALILAALVAALWRRYRRTSPDFLADAEKDARGKALVWYRAILSLLSMKGVYPEGGESPSAFAERAVGLNAAPDDFALLTGRITAAQYAGRQPDARTVALSRSVYEKMVKGLDVRLRAGWVIRRLRYGIGDLKRIP